MDFSQSYINKGNYIEGRLHEDKHENSWITCTCRFHGPP
jgi:hypothetical protein